MQEKDKEYIKDAYTKLREKLGRQPGNKEFYKETGISEYHIIQNFRKYSLLVKEMGGIEKSFGEQQYPIEEYWISYGNLTRELGKFPTTSDWRFYKCKPIISSFSKRFNVKWSELPSLFSQYVLGKGEWEDLSHLFPNENPLTTEDATLTVPLLELKYSDFLPPVLNEFIEKSINEEHSTEFEKQVALIFQMLGFDSTYMGQGTGRNPDCIAKASQNNYSVLIDAKTRGVSYRIGTEDRKFIEYIKTHRNSLNKSGHNLLYFLIVSSEFNGEYLPSVQNIKKETGVDTSFIKATTLLKLLAKKIEHPLKLGTENFQELFVSNPIIEDSRLERLFKQLKIS